MTNSKRLDTSTQHDRAPDERRGEALMRRMHDQIHADKPAWRGWLHFIALCVAVPAVLALIWAASGGMVRVAAGVYGASVIGLFGASSAYHLLGRTSETRQWLRKLDHSMIFVLIAGTYTPIISLVLPATWSVPLLIVIWAAAATGVLLKVTTLTEDGGSGSWLYIVMGWAAVVATPMLLSELGVMRFSLLIAGGLLYTVGAVILAKGRPNPSPRLFGYHEVWHSFTIVAGLCHVTLVAMLAGG